MCKEIEVGSRVRIARDEAVPKFQGLEATVERLYVADVEVRFDVEDAARLGMLSDSGGWPYGFDELEVIA